MSMVFYCIPLAIRDARGVISDMGVEFRLK